MIDVICPKCHALHTRRIKQDGFFQKVILQRLGYFPWECRFCKATFVLKNRGHRISEDKRSQRRGKTDPGVDRLDRHQDQGKRYDVARGQR